MTRGRNWRRYIEYKKVIKRLKNDSLKNYWRYTDSNDIPISNYMWIDLIGSQRAYLFKNITTSVSYTRNKDKWGHKSRKTYNYTSDPNTRVKDKKRFKKELNELGLKHLPTEYRPKLEG